MEQLGRLINIGCGKIQISEFHTLHNFILKYSKMSQSRQLFSSKDIRRFRNKCDIVEEPNSSSKHGIVVKFSSLIRRNLVFKPILSPLRCLPTWDTILTGRIWPFYHITFITETSNVEAKIVHFL